MVWFNEWLWFAGVFSWCSYEKGISWMLLGIVDSCKGCTLAAKAPATTCKPWPKTVQPWQRIHVDFSDPLDDQYYLIAVDSHTKWPEVLKCKRPTTNCTIGFLHELFAHFGVVDCVVTDNGTQFMSNEFKQFCDTYQVKHIMTLQYHPRSNGQAERFVDTLKRALKKAQIGRSNSFCRYINYCINYCRLFDAKSSLYIGFVNA